MGSEGFENSCYNTEDGISLSLSNLGTYRLIFISTGSDMHESKSSITRSLCDQIFTSPHTLQRLPLMPSTLVQVV